MSGGDDPDIGGDDPEIRIIKARKMRQLREHAATLEKLKENSDSGTSTKKTDREILLSYLYDRGDEVLKLAESQYPSQTKIIVSKLAQLIREGEISNRISGGELLALFRYAGLLIRVNTSIKIEDHGKYISFSEKLKQEQ
jgi:DNA-binding TFAR19-related protein (PDSD5 family)